MMNFDNGTDLIDYITENNLLDVAWEALPNLKRKKVQAWFGDFTLLSGDIPENQIAIIHEIDEKVMMYEDEVDDYCWDKKHDSWLIPSEYKGQIVYSANYVRKLKL